MRRFFGPMGSVTRLAIESQALKNNMLGDPSVRTVDVYVPAGHDGEGLPLLVDLVGFTGSGLSHTNWAGFREHPRAAPLRHLVGRGLSFRRYGLRIVLSARHAGGPTRTRRRRELDRALVATA